MHLFDHTVKPVLLYGSEIWGTINTASAKVKKDPFSLLNTLYDMPCEKLHIRFPKYLLAVNRKTTNAAVMGELGRFPIMIDILCNTVKYFQGSVSGSGTGSGTGPRASPVRTGSASGSMLKIHCVVLTINNDNSERKSLPLKFYMFTDAILTGGTTLVVRLVVWA